MEVGGADEIISRGGVLVPALDNDFFLVLLIEGERLCVREHTSLHCGFFPASLWTLVV